MPEHEEALVNLGVIAFQQKDFTSAKQYFEKVIAVNPNNGSALGNLGAIYHNQNDLQQAINYYDQSLALTPTNAEIYKNIIKIYTALGNTAKVQEYQQRMSQYAR